MNEPQNEHVHSLVAHAAVREVAVVGTGLLGASAGLALRARGVRVTGVDTDRTRARRARRLGALDRDVASIRDLGRPDLAIVATPPDHIAPVVSQLLELGVAVVTDVGSVKGAVVSAVSDPRFVPGHPMAGSDGTGPEAARADLFVGARWILAPRPMTSEAALVIVEDMVRALGASPVRLTAAEHDDYTAAVSHVPHLASAALALHIGRHPDAEQLYRLAAGGLRDMTRIANGDADLWTSITALNPSLAKQLHAVAALIEEMAGAVERDDRARLKSMLDEARGPARLVREATDSRGQTTVGAVG